MTNNCSKTLRDTFRNFQARPRTGRCGGVPARLHQDGILLAALVDPVVRRAALSSVIGKNQIQIGDHFRIQNQVDGLIARVIACAHDTAQRQRKAGATSPKKKRGKLPMRVRTNPPPTTRTHSSGLQTNQAFNDTVRFFQYLVNSAQAAVVAAADACRGHDGIR